ncbi:MAG: four-carbon acid sugar kinase family protein [Candidatus Latescibacteria bacterium]|nr:four-carbon acid sugar kinase family protein [Candidatus Latescibacterota bacterium]
MEALTYAGVPTVLFVGAPSTAQLERFSHARAVGVAGISRSLAKEEMAAELAPAFARLQELGAPLCHYKTCSTFDSSPDIGNIGLAIETGRPHFAAPFVPLVVGAPVLQRFCLFGNLFARSGLDSGVFRLDRHPTMRHHPITPMDEADLRLHLGRQTKLSTGLFDVLQLDLPADQRRAAFAQLLAGGPDLVLFDTLSEAHLAPVGELIWTATLEHGSLFSAGSSGLEYALTAYWRQQGWLPPLEREFVGEPVDQLVVVSGSCSPVTQRQIDYAVAHGFIDIELATVDLVDSERAPAAIAAAVEAALDVLAQGRSPLLHTARGGQDARIGQTAARLRQMGYSDLDIKLHSGALFGRALGGILQGVLQSRPLSRAVIAGGDTSAYVARQVGIEALEVVGPMAPGSPLCRVHAAAPPLDGMEITFKGGQVGRDDFFLAALRGTP